MRSRVLAELWWGFSLVFALHLGFTALALLLVSLVGSSGWPGSAFIWFFTLFGLSQLLYVLPIMRLYWVQGRRERVKGMAIAAIITMTLNGSCYVMNFGGIQIFIGICLSLVSLFVLAILGSRRG
jgi:heme/copper-type cytochrome/quinol oxidase subunit 4